MIRRNLFWSLVVTAGLFSPSVCMAQSLTLESTTVSVAAASSTDGRPVADALSRAQKSQKFKKLLEYAGTQVGQPLKPAAKAGFSSTVTDRFTRDGHAADSKVTMTFIPLEPSKSKPAAKAAAMMLVSYQDAPELDYCRLLIRPEAGKWHTTEYALRKDGKVTEMTAKFGDCVFRSGLLTLEQKSADAHKSLRAALDGAGSRPLIDELRAVYDVRGRSVGQKNLLLASSLYVAGNWEEEHDGGYVEGIINKIKPDRKENPLKAEALKLIKSSLGDIAKNAAKWLAKLFGIF